MKSAAQKEFFTIDVDAIKDKATEATSTLVEKAGEFKDAAVAVKDDIADKLTELDRMLQESVTEYNDAYTLMNDKGVQLYIERCRALDLISFVENLVNGIANRPKSFDAEFAEISVHRKNFTDSREFADRELQEAQKAAVGAGAGRAAGVKNAELLFEGIFAIYFLYTPRLRLSLKPPKQKGLPPAIYRRQALFAANTVAVCYFNSCSTCSGVQQDA